MCNGRRGWYGNQFADQAWGAHGWEGPSGKQVPVNIIDNETGYEILVYAPGLQKTGFKVLVKDDKLHVQYQPSAKEVGNSLRYTRREYQQVAFERSFVLNGKVETENIQAQYLEGILRVSLTRNAQSTQPARDISVG